MSEQDVLGALADPMRRRVLEGIGAHGEATATMLASGLPVSRQAVVQHLAVLERAGLVRGRKEGREVRFTVCPDALTETAGWLTGLADRWAGRLATIKQIAEQDSGENPQTGAAPRRRGPD